ncbi:hypothetical protein E4U59_006186 [Claviceps monticola]|nr:hypothetical protein E4U59_006186 [Claviceps monticola]
MSRQESQERRQTTSQDYLQPSLADKVPDARDGSFKLFKISLAWLEESNQSQRFEPSSEHHFADAGHRVAVGADISLVHSIDDFGRLQPHM